METMENLALPRVDETESDKSPNLVIERGFQR